MSTKRRIGLCTLITLAAAFSALAELPPSPPPATPEQTATVEELIPVTVGNLRGHQMLYDEGWFVVTSSRKALAYARDKSLISSAQALQRVRRDYAQDSSAYGEEIKSDLRGAGETGGKVFATGTGISGEILSTTKELAAKELAYSQESFQQAMDALIRGNLTLGKRTETERRELVNLPGNYYRNLKSDFSNIRELTDAANRKFADRIEVGWDTAFRKASQSFHEEYEQSGNKPNSLMALGPILSGYLRAFYHGLAAPTAKSIVKGGAKGTTEALFLPVAGVTMVTGRTIESVGLTVYYTGKSGVKLVSPTVEGGLLSGLALLSLGTVPPTYVTGGTLGAMNQVAFTTVSPVVTVAEAATTTVVDTAKYVSFLAYDSVSGTTQVVINQASSGVVLGYNAMTALPAHAFLGAVDLAIFLAYDGPRLVIASASGKVGSGAKRASLGDLPVGSVVDLKKLQQSGQVEVKIISEDEAVIREVLQKLPTDLTVDSSR